MTAGCASAGNTVRLEDACGEADPQPVQPCVQPATVQAAPRIPKIILIGSERIVLPPRLDDDYVLRPYLGEGNFGVVMRCGATASRPCDCCTLHGTDRLSA